MDRTMGYGSYLLLHYREMSAHVALLEQELATAQAVTEDDMIQILALGRHTQPGRGSKGKVKDRTGTVALVYQEAARRLNESTRRQLQVELEVGRGELCRLERALTALPGLQQAVLTGLYLEGRTGSYLCEELSISPRSLYRYRKAGLAQLDAIFAGGER